MSQNLFRFEGVPDRPDVEQVMFHAGVVQKGGLIELKEDELPTAVQFGLQPAEDVSDADAENAVKLPQEQLEEDVAPNAVSQQPTEPFQGTAPKTGAMGVASGGQVPPNAEKQGGE